MLAICLALINDDEDKKSFEQLVKKFEKKLYTESFKILRSHELAEEAVWETFYRIADNFHKIHNLPVYIDFITKKKSISTMTFMKK